MSPTPSSQRHHASFRSRRTEIKHRRTPFQHAHWTHTHDRPWDPQSSRDQGTTRQGWTSREPWKSALSHGRFPWLGLVSGLRAGAWLRLEPLRTDGLVAAVVGLRGSRVVLGCCGASLVGRPRDASAAGGLLLPGYVHGSCCCCGRLLMHAAVDTKSTASPWLLWCCLHRLIESMTSGPHFAVHACKICWTISPLYRDIRVDR
ncbi:hypothetical protein IWX90DRAFT_190114 [Phyllosticta citrichinensis]|uniref:Uncharacterized protein n=1 Tax=Phyllosticta citrichinensis TaxID=1130410 RepID=A0ABR1XWW0_9PEZI